MKKNLQELREAIDIIDADIIKLLAKRIENVKLVGEYKAERGIMPLDTNRWQKVVESKMKQAKTLGISEKLIKDIYERVHQEALEIENKI